MVDQIDMANEIASAAADRAIAAARADAPVVKPFLGTCNACLAEDVHVLHRGGMLRCVDCRTKWEKRR